MLRFDDALAALRAIGEATRLRIVALLAHGELSVSDITEVLGQSQPRISRHLKLLTDAGVVERNREGNFVYFALTQRPAVRAVVDTVLAACEIDDAQLVADRQRLDQVRERRVATAKEYFERIADEWDQIRSLHAPDDMVERAIVDALDADEFATILDIGTGTGRMLELLAARPGVSRAAGLDPSHSMLTVARGNLDRAGIHGAELRQGAIESPPFDAGSFDLVVIHQVLHYLDEPDRAVASAARLVAPGGRLLIVDFAPHDLAFLQTEHNHRRLGFRTATIVDWLGAAGLRVLDTNEVTGNSLTVSIWLAQLDTSKVLS